MLEAVSLPIIEVGVIVLLALFAGLVMKRLNLASSLGYMIAGMALGPLFLKFLIPDQGIAPLFGEIGLLMLMFYLGLELSIKNFKQNGAVATILLALEFALFFVLGFALARFFGFNEIESLVVAAILPFSSTAVIVKFIIEKGWLEKTESRIAISTLVLEDFLSILVLVFLSSLQTHKSLNLLVLNAVLFTIAAFFVVSRVSKFLLAWLSKTGHSDNPMTLYAIGIGLLVGKLGEFLGLSPILGAYFAGFALAETAYGNRIKRELGFFREFFILFFFVSFGATIQLPSSWAFLGTLVLVLVAFYVVLKILLYGVFGSLLGLNTESAVNAGLLMIAVGEFSIIIASAGAPLTSRPSEILAAAFLLTLLTTMVGPLLFNYRKQILEVFRKVFPENAFRYLRLFSGGTNLVDRISSEHAFQNEYSRLAKSILYNLVIAFAVVYISYASTYEVSLGVIPKISAGILILVMITWPIYRIISDLHYLMGLVVGSLLHSQGFAKPGRKHPLTVHAANVFIGLLLTLLGAGSGAFLYFRNVEPFFILIPLVFFLLALMYLSKSVYSLFEEASSLSAFAESETSQQPELRSLAREFDLRSRKLSELNELRSRAQEEIQIALREGNPARARHLLSAFKKRERSLAESLSGIEKKLERSTMADLESLELEDARALSRLEKQETHTRRALENYFRKQPPNFSRSKKKR